ncbi:MAG: WecB/TagA/CpsF family glycosyltransferase [Lachnospiraceae bacterium]|nr:WecB/TagA/CpsF family glycosyltransferase [Lachnospiraceae bacterium]
MFTPCMIDTAVILLKDNAKKLVGKYVCFSNVHTSVMAREDDQYRDILNGAAYVFADGKPVAEAIKKMSNVPSERVAGPDFMGRFFAATEDKSLSHFFYGSTDATLEGLKKNLSEKYPGLDIKGFYSPPFKELSDKEDEEIIDMLNSSGADIIWVGLGAPRQEKWMAEHKDKINALMLGVGAGFDFHGGTVKRAPGFMQRIGLEWLYRLFQDPGRLFSRYLKTNLKFAVYFFLRKNR